ncbi:hypothetical protein CEK25_012388 [Fusarium fujikuroi]|nr:hypothetical protein CEK25_012388 [Fusarium fujikuroi]
MELHDWRANHNNGIETAVSTIEFHNLAIFHYLPSYLYLQPNVYNFMSSAVLPRESNLIETPQYLSQLNPSYAVQLHSQVGFFPQESK